VIRPGDELGPSEWLEVQQGRIDAFATATEDHESIHVSPALAAAGPYGTPVAHGFLTLSLIAYFWHELTARAGWYSVAVNYGLNRVRFPDPVPAGSRVRGRFRVEAVDPVDGGMHATVASIVEREGGAKPACVAETVFRLLG
jgi:acyl dehydratase